MTWIIDRIGRRIRLADLHILMVTAEAGSMGKAARRLNTSQPAISRCIAELERELGVALLDRTARGVEPTPYGRTLLDAAASAFDSLRSGIQHIGYMNDPSSGTLRIGGQEALIAALLPDVLNGLHATFPRMSVHAKSVVAVDQQYAELRERRLDFIVGRIRPPYEDDIAVELLFDEKTYVVAAASNPWSQRRRQFAFAELADEPWALPLPGTMVGALFADAFQASGVAYPPVSAAFGNLSLHCELVAVGRYLAILPASVLRRNAARFGFRMLPVPSPVLASPVGVLRLRNRELSTFALSFIEKLRSQARAAHDSSVYQEAPVPLDGAVERDIRVVEGA